MFNPFVNTHNAALTLSVSSNASEKGNKVNFELNNINKQNLISLFQKETKKNENFQVKQAFELVA